MRLAGSGSNNDGKAENTDDKGDNGGEGLLRNRAESLQALYEARADMECRRQTGRHFLETVRADDLRKNPSPAVC